MYRYAQIDVDGKVISDSCLSGKVKQGDMIDIESDFDLTNKRYVDGEWVEFVEDIKEEKPINQLDRIEANLDYIIMLTE